MSECLIVGLDGRDRSLAAIRFAAWLRRLGADRQALRLEGVHAYVEADLQALADKVRVQKAIAVRYREIRDWLEELELDGEFAELSVELGSAAKDVLQSECRRGRPLALVIGRRAKASGATLPPRLGAIARRILRHPPAPVIVVPPDYDPHRHGTGDVVVLTDMADEADPALRFAAVLAERCGRQVRPLHVVPEGFARPRATAGSTEIDHALLERTAAEVDAWVAARKIEAAPTRVAVGMVVDATLETVEALEPLVVVVGTRELSLGERALLTSHSSELAAKAACPVAIVPPAQSLRSTD